MRSRTYEYSEVDSANGPNLDHEFPMGMWESWKRHSLQEGDHRLGCLLVVIVQVLRSVELHLETPIYGL